MKTTPHICHNHYNRWLRKKNLTKCKIFQLERKKLLYTQCKFLRNFKCKVSRPQIAVV